MLSTHVLAAAISCLDLDLRLSASFLYFSIVSLDILNLHSLELHGYNCPIHAPLIKRLGQLASVKFD